MNAGFATHRAAIIVAFIVVALCYLNSLPNEFVFDDGPIVASNPAIRTISPIRFLTSPYWANQQQEGIYRPFTIFSLSVDYAIWKRWAPGFRLTNFAVHAINGALLFLLCMSFGLEGTLTRRIAPPSPEGRGIAPWVAMLIYLVHPAQIEAVTTIVGRSELFSACFFLSAWLLFRRGHTAWPAVLFLLALLSKENAIVLPAVLALDVLLTRQRATAMAQPGLWRRFAVLLGTAAAYLMLRFYVLGAFGIPVAAQYMGGRLTYVERLLTSGRVFLEYLRLLVFPVNLAGDYDFNAIPIANFASWDAWL